MAALTIVTGGSAGLGRAVLAAAPAGHRVDVSRSGPDRKVAEQHIEADLSDPTSWQQVVDEIGRLVHERAWERVVLVHAAGTLEPIGFAGEVDRGAYVANVVLNSAAPQVLGAGFLRAVQPLEVPRDLVLISSGAARTAYPGWSAYGAGKAAADHWVRAVAEEQRRRGGVRVLSIAPGVVETAMQRAIRSTEERDFPAVARFRDLHQAGDLVGPEEAAHGLWEVLDDPSVEGGSVLDLRRR
jgi:benzil reductase ((S)-benzoin forming)